MFSLMNDQSQDHLLVNWCIWQLLFIAFAHWIDVCPNNENLLAAGGTSESIKIFDKRESKIIKTYENTHSGQILCSN